MKKPKHCSLDGANTLAKRVEQYWRARGHVVNTQVDPCEFRANMKATCWQVRSDMVNGWPVKGE